ncbi:hypothetical protein HU200_029408 [Digitaria exilis]|uniref:Uncharacterized protein n=1 Tax=Digitaria exilis TaxID=1010633 RepID=A0A835C293_9POAL|nr:hypothetical protein HU200_029408 [Digitaria exilis]
MSLVATAVPASRRSLEASLICSQSKNCNPDTCGATCINGVGVCKNNGGVSCCCIPKPSTSVGGPGNNHLLH